LNFYYVIFFEKREKREKEKKKRRKKKCFQINSVEFFCKEKKLNIIKVGVLQAFIILNRRRHENI